MLQHKRSHGTPSRPLQKLEAEAVKPPHSKTTTCMRVEGEQQTDGRQPRYPIDQRQMAPTTKM